MAPSPFSTPGTRYWSRLDGEEPRGRVRLVGELAGGADFGHVLAVELVEDALQRAVLRERVLPKQRFGLDAVDADVLRVPRGDQEVPVGRVAHRPEVLPLHVMLRRELVRALAPARQVAPPVDGSLHLRYASFSPRIATFLRVPDVHAAVHARHDQLVRIATPVQRHHLRRMAQRLFEPAAQQIPRPHGVIPRP